MLDMIKKLYQNSSNPCFILTPSQEILWLNEVAKTFHLAIVEGGSFLSLLDKDQIKIWQKKDLQPMEVVELRAMVQGYTFECTKLETGWMVVCAPSARGAGQDKPELPIGYENLKGRLKSPLMRILGEASSLYYTPELWGDFGSSMSLVEKNQVIDSVQLINHQGFCGFRLLEELQCYQQLNSVGHHVENDTVLINPLLSFIIDTISLYNKTGIKIRFDMEEKLSVYGNKDLLQMCLLELVVNALKNVSIEEGEVCVSAYRKDERVIISIEDDGWGMSEETLSKAFSPFYCGEDGNGVGLGLTNARLGILAQDGNILLQSVRDEGTVVTISLHEVPYVPNALSSIMLSGSRFNMCNVILSDIFDIPIG